VSGELRRDLGFWGGLSVVVGTVIGGGIFRTPATIASVLPDPLLILALWAVVGAITLCGALSLAELASLLPKTGGTYVYLRAAYGDAAAFAFGWLYLLAAIPSGFAALAAFFGELVLRACGRDPAAAPGLVTAVAAGAVVVLSAANVLGVRFGAVVQKVFAGIKVAALLGIIAACLLSGQADPARLSGGEFTFRGLASAVAFVMFTYNGWVYVSLVAGEVESAETRMKRILIAGTLTVIGLYLGANLSYLLVVPVAEMPGTVVAREALIRTAGPWAGTLVMACIGASVFGALNGIVLSKARVPYALARDGLSFAFLGRCHPRFATPHVSILVLAAITVALLLWLRSFDALAAYFVVVEWFALLFAIAAVLVLRRKLPGAPRPYRVPGCPWVPLVFIVGTTLGLAAIVWSSAAKGRWEPLIGLGISLAGFPVHSLWRRWS
jgi:amino acid transporter